MNEEEAMSDDCDDSKRYSREELMELIEARENCLQEKLLERISEIEASHAAEMRRIQGETFEGIVQRELGAISQHLAPLRELAPSRTALDDEAKKRLDRIHTLLKRPLWRRSAFEVESGDAQPVKKQWGAK
jgi:hypothetical protein